MIMSQFLKKAMHWKLQSFKYTKNTILKSLTECRGISATPSLNIRPHREARVQVQAPFQPNGQGGSK